MENNNIDKIFKQSLQDRKMKPSADSWDRLSNMLEKDEVSKPPKRKFSWWHYFLVIGLFVVGSTYIYGLLLEESTITTPPPARDTFIPTKVIEFAESPLKESTPVIQTTKETQLIIKTDKIDNPQTETQLIARAKNASSKGSKLVNNPSLTENETIENSNKNKRNPNEDVAQNSLPNTPVEEKYQTEEQQQIVRVEDKDILNKNEALTQNTAPEIIATEDIEKEKTYNLDAEVANLLASSLSTVKSNSINNKLTINPQILLDEAEDEGYKTYMQRVIKKVNKKTSSAYAFISKRNRIKEK